jgi:hypothetical protein
MALIERVAHSAGGAHEGDAVPFEGFDTVRRQWRISRKTRAPIEVVVPKVKRCVFPSTSTA